MKIKFFEEHMPGTSRNIAGVEFCCERMAIAMVDAGCIVFHKEGLAIDDGKNADLHTIKYCPFCGEKI